MDEAASLQNDFAAIQQQLGRAVVGHESLVEQLMVALLAGGHVLLEGSAGAAKTLTARQLANALDLSFTRVRCSPDMLPADMIGSTSSADPEASPTGPVFGQVVLVDDLQRLPAKSHTVIQQVMQDESLVFAGEEYDLPTPRILIATAYTSEEAVDAPREPRDDRFMLKIKLNYPSFEEECRIADQQSGELPEPLQPILTAQRLLELQQHVRGVELPEAVQHYAVRLVRSTRHDGETSDFVYEWVSMGASPRAAHHLALAARIRAALYGRKVATIEDVREMVFPILRHRIETNQNARSTGITVDRVIARLVYETPEEEAAE